MHPASAFNAAPICDSSCGRHSETMREADCGGGLPVIASRASKRTTSASGACSRFSTFA